MNRAAKFISWARKVGRSSMFFASCACAADLILEGKGRAVDRLQAEDLATRFNAVYCETSAKNGKGVADLFQRMGTDAQVRRSMHIPVTKLITSAGVARPGRARNGHTCGGGHGQCGVSGAAHNVRGRRDRHGTATRWRRQEGLLLIPWSARLSRLLVCVVRDCRLVRMYVGCAQTLFPMVAYEGNAKELIIRVGSVRFRYQRNSFS